jgi:hypothetical protein
MSSPTEQTIQPLRKEDAEWVTPSLSGAAPLRLAVGT